MDNWTYCKIYNVYLSCLTKGGPDRKASDGSPLVLIQGPRGLVAMKRSEVASVMKEKKMLERELNKVGNAKAFESL